MVAGWCQLAGWHGADLEHAVAVAMAATGGDDSYRWVIGPEPTIDLRGVFALDLVAHPHLADVNLYDPLTNARAARQLWLGADKSWGWHPSHVNGSYLAHVMEAREAARRPTRHGEPPTDAMAAVAGRVVERFVDTARRIAAGADRVGRLRP